MSNMKCPFCGAELEDDIFYAGRKFYSCINPKCKINDWGGCSEQILQALIEGKKAREALKVATDFIGFVNTSRHADGALAAMAIGKLNKITSIIKQDKMS